MANHKVKAIREVSFEVEKLFDEAKQYAGIDVIEGEGGLRWQFEHELIDEVEIATLIHKYKTIKSLVERGIWKP